MEGLVSDYSSDAFEFGSQSVSSASVEGRTNSRVVRVERKQRVKVAVRRIRKEDSLEVVANFRIGTARRYKLNLEH